MNHSAHTGFLLAAAFLLVFAEAALSGVRWLIGAQLNLLPSLVVYAAVAGSLTQVSLVAFCGGIWFDSLSANPLGISVVPLLVVGLAVSFSRELVMREQPFAQAIIGLAASAAAPVLTLLLLLSAGYNPLVGWGTLWQVAVMAAGGALFTPAWFLLFQWVQHALQHGRVPDGSFRADREIRRGRA